MTLPVAVARTFSASETTRMAVSVDVFDSTDSPGIEAM